MRTLITRRPDVHVAMRKVLALPTERAFMAGQRLPDQIDRLPKPLDDTDGICIAGQHLAVARLDEADLQPAARDHIGHCVFLGHTYWITAHSDQGALA